MKYNCLVFGLKKIGSKKITSLKAKRALLAAIFVAVCTNAALSQTRYKPNMADYAGQTIEWNNSSGQWKYLSTLTGWQNAGDFPGYQDNHDARAYFPTDTVPESVQLTASPYKFKGICINYYYNNESNSGDELVTIDLNGFELNVEQILMGSTNSGKTQTQVHFANTAGTPCTITADELALPAGFTHNITLDSTITLNVTTLNLGLAPGDGSGTITLNLAGGGTVNVNTVHVYEGNTAEFNLDATNINTTSFDLADSSATTGTTLTVSGSGTLTTQNFAFYGDSSTHSLTVQSGATFAIRGDGTSGEYHADSSAGTLNWLGSGTLTIPASGAIQEEGQGTIDYSGFSGTIEQFGAPTYYSMNLADEVFSGSSYSATLTLTRQSSSGTAEVEYPFTAKITTSSTFAGSFSIGSESITADISLDDGKTLTVESGSISQDFAVIGSNLASGDKIEITLYTPDKNFKLGTITFEFLKYLWNGSTDTNWLTTANWTLVRSDGTQLSPESFPPYTSGGAEIELLSTAANSLNLEGGITESGVTTTNLSLGAVTVQAGAKLLLGECYISVAESFVNAGTVAANGTQSTPPITATDGDQSKITHEDGSVIEYTGSGFTAFELYASKNGAVKQFKNLIINAPADSSFTISDELYIAEDAEINKSISASDKITAIGNLTIDGSSQFADDIAVGKDLTVHADSTFNGEVTVGSNMEVSAEGTFAGEVSVTGDMTISEQSSFTGAVTVTGNVELSDVTSFDDNVTVMGALTVSANITQTAVLTVGQNAEIQAGATDVILGDVTVGGDLTILASNSAKIAGDVSVTGNFICGTNANFESTVLVQQYFTIQDSSTAEFLNDVTVQNNFTVGSDTTVTAGGDVSVTKNCSFATESTATFSKTISIGANYKNFGTAQYNQSLQAGGNCTLSGTQTFADGAPLSVTGNLTTEAALNVTGTVNIGGLTVINAETSDIILQNPLNTFTGDVELASAGTVALNAAQNSSLTLAQITAGLTELSCAELTIGTATNYTFITNIKKSITTTGTQNFYSPVILYANTTLLCGTSDTPKDLTFYSTVNAAAGTTPALTVGSAAIKSNANFKETIGGTTALGALTVFGKALITSGSYTAQNQIFYDSVTIDSTGIAARISSSLGSIEFMADVTGTANLTGTFALTASTKGVFITGAATLNTGSLIQADSDVFISAGSSTNAVTLCTPLTTTKSFVLLNGALTLEQNLTATNDIVFLNGAASTIYADTGTACSGVTNLFAYINPLRNGTTKAAPSLTAFPGQTPSGTAISAATYSSSVTLGTGGAGGITLQCGKNFYANGTNLAPSAAWTLTIPSNDSAANSFAELYNAQIYGCTVSALSGTAALSAAEGCTDGGENTGVYFSRPQFSTTDCYTVYDNVIHVSFVDSISGNATKIENSNNEISAAVSNISFYDGTTLVQFKGAYTDSECTISTDGKGDLAEFYLKTPDSYRFNTDATGTSSGSEQSTDSTGTHSTAIPQIDVPKALSSVFCTITDEHKNRIADCSAQNGSAAFTGTLDKTSPVLIALYTGQELHSAPDGTGTNQKPYDSHNFIEFQYSEAVNIGTVLPLTTTTEEDTVNIQVTNALGAITVLSSGGVRIAGLANVQSGSLTCGQNGSSSTTVHSLYRTFALTANNAAALTPEYQTHRLRISVAGYSNGTITASAGTFLNWQGYIDSAEQLSGTVTPLTNNLITDAAGNTLDAAGTAQHALTAITVNSTESELYGAWDISAPVFAPYVKVDSTTVSNEAIGASESGAVTLNRIEFHLFDNAQDDMQNAKWFSRVGWGSSATALFTQESYGADIFGGARPFTGSTQSRTTSGGIRYSTLYNKSSSFKYTASTGASGSQAFSSAEITGGAKSSVFLPLTGTKRATGTEDSLYFSVYLQDTTLPLQTTFSVTYNQNACITDLAGNRLKSAEITNIDRVPPSFYITQARLMQTDQDTAANKMLLVLNKKLNLSQIYLTKSLDGSEESHTIFDSLRFIKIDDSGNATEVTDLSFDATVAPQEIFKDNEIYTGIILTLSRPVTLDDVLNYHVQCYSPAENTYNDPLTGISNVSVTTVQDTFGNFMAHGTSHAISDFAVGIAEPVLAYDRRLIDRDAADAADENSVYVIRDWNADQQNLGTLLSDSDLTFSVKLWQTATTLPKNLVMYYANSPTVGSVSQKINENLNLDLRYWIPSAVTADSATVAVSPVEALALKTNAANFYANSETEDGTMFTFTLKNSSDDESTDNESTLSKNGFKSGDQVSFMFSLHDESLNPLKICHAPEYNEITGSYDISNQQPIFAARLINQNDLTSLDLWSFRLKGITEQRGNVTILNNVINASAGENTLIQVNTKSDGNLNVAIMTLDGNVITYLQHGKTTAGTHTYSWNGTTKSGKKVARGLYFVRVFGNGIDETRKVMVVKD